MFYVILVSKCTFQNMIWLKCFFFCLCRHVFTAFGHRTCWRGCAKDHIWQQSQGSDHGIHCTNYFFFFFMCVFSIFFSFTWLSLLFPTFSGQSWALYSAPIPWRSLDPSAHKKTQTFHFSTNFWRLAGRIWTRPLMLRGWLKRSAPYS